MILPDRREGAAGAQVDDAIDILLSLASPDGAGAPKGGRASRPADEAAGRRMPRPLRPAEHPPPAGRRRSAPRAARRTMLAGLVIVLAVVPDIDIRPPLAAISPARSSLDTLLSTASTLSEAVISLGGRLTAALPARGKATAAAATGPEPSRAKPMTGSVEAKPARQAWKDPDRATGIVTRTAEAARTPRADLQFLAEPAAAIVDDELPLQGVPAGVVDHGDPLDPPTDATVAPEPPAVPDRGSDEAIPSGAAGGAGVEARLPEPPPADAERWMEPLVQALVARSPGEEPSAETAAAGGETPQPTPTALPTTPPPPAATPDEVVAALTEALAREREAILQHDRERSAALAREIADLRSELEDLRARSLEMAQAAPAPAPRPNPAPPADSVPAQIAPAQIAPAQIAPAQVAPAQVAPPQLPPALGAPTQAAPQPPPSPAATPSAGRLLARAEALIKAHDISGARLVLERAVAEGSAQAAFLLAQTYDPRALASWGVVGIRPDPDRADQLYARAQAGGVREAGERLSRR